MDAAWTLTPRGGDWLSTAGDGNENDNNWTGRAITTAAAADEVDATVVAINSVGVYSYFCILAVVIPVGLVCNAFSVGIFVTATKFRRTSTGQFLIALAAADWLVLIGDALRWLCTLDEHRVYITGLHFLDTSVVACKLVNVWRYSSKLLSVWLTVAITVERLTAVALPLKVGRLSTPFRARCTVAALTAACLAFCLYPLWTVSVDTDEYGDPACLYLLPTEDEYKIWTTVVVRVGTFALPISLLVICSALIIYFLARAQQTRPQSTRGGDRHSATSSTAIQRHSTASSDSAKSTQRQLTIMLIAICVAAVCLQLPYIVLYFVNDRKFNAWPGDEHRVLRARIFAAVKFTEAVATVSYAINFFLFCVSGSAFRRHVGRVFRRCLGRGDGRRMEVTGTSWCSTSRSEVTSPAIRLQQQQQQYNRNSRANAAATISTKETNE